MKRAESLADAIWNIRKEVWCVADRTEGDTRRVMALALAALETAGSMEDSKDMEARRQKADELVRQWQHSEE